MPTLNINGADLQVWDRGRGPAILFVHGFPLTHAMWEAQMADLEDSHRILAPDLRGFGESSMTPGTVSMEQFADDLAGIFDQLGVAEPVTLCGLSMGGYIAWQFVRKYPERLKALILCDTKASADSPEAVENRHKLAASVMKHGVGVVAQAMPEKLFAAQTLGKPNRHCGPLQRDDARRGSRRHRGGAAGHGGTSRHVGAAAEDFRAHVGHRGRRGSNHDGSRKCGKWLKRSRKRRSWKFRTQAT